DGKDLVQCVRDPGLVIDAQDTEAPRSSVVSRLVGVRQARSTPRQDERKDGAAARVLRYVDTAAMGLYNARAQRQADARAFADRLRREERFEYPFADLFRYAWAVVLHGHLDLAMVEPGRDPDATRRAGYAQRLSCVDDQVGQHLVDLVRIGGDHRQIVG